MSIKVKTAVILSTFLTSMLLSQPALAKKSSKLKFNESQIEVPFKLTHPIMLIDLLPINGKEIVTFSVDDNETRWLIIYSYDEETKSYAESDRQVMPKDLYSFDITESYENMKQTLYFLSSKYLYQYDALAKNTDNKFAKVTTVNSFAVGDSEQYLAKGDFLHDLNNDQLDDIVIPDFNQVNILTAQSNGSMLQQSLPIKPQIDLSADSARYTRTKLYFSDINFDQRRDVIVVGEGEFEYYLQDEQGIFSQQAQQIKLNELISGIEWWNKPSADGENIDQSQLVYKKVEQVKDINNDNITDMVVRFTQSSGLLDRVNDYEVYLGKNVDGQLTFADEPNSTIKAEGTLTGLEFIDIDNDDKLEVMLAGFDIGLSQIIGALLSGSIDQDVYVFKMDENDNFTKDLKVAKEVELSFSISSGTSGSPVVKLADINGDKRQDLVLSDGDDALKVYYGTKGKKLFSKRALKYKVTLPKQGSMLISDDLNGDGKDDLLIKYGRQDDDKLKNVFRILLSI
ncbi:MAG: VCBS repeat-containing protein [Colwellia sp.]|nr:VCBS repeat-containing protein [Colwellia sp.]